MAKNLKINIKNTQLAEALNLKKIKKPIKKATKKQKKVEEESVKKPKVRIIEKPKEEVELKLPVEEKPIEKKAKETILKEPQEEKVEIKEPILEKTIFSTPAEKQPQTETKKEEQEVKSKKFIKEKTQKKPVETKKQPTKPIEKKESPQKEPLKKPTEKKKEDGSYKDFKAFKRFEKQKFDARDRMGLSAGDEGRWRKKRFYKSKKKDTEETTIRPKSLKIKLPITIKDLAAQMKLKAAELIAKLFKQGIVVTLNDYLDDETVVQLLGHEFECTISIDTSKEERLRITDRNIKQEIKETENSELKSRPPVITFMGHVDHGKTSIIDCIRSSNITASEAGAITQHIGAFYTKTPTGNITILDTPGHEAFIEMRQRGALVTDIAILVIAGDEGIREQTQEAINQAKAAEVPIIVAINKSDKVGFDPEKVYRQLADLDLLPEAWGGTTITVNCSAVKKEGIKELLEMINLQAEILELKANPHARARGTILESERHKGFGIVATVLVQNGTLKISDSIVFGSCWGKVKTMHDQFNISQNEAGPSIPVKITGLSDLAEAGIEFIVVENEKIAKDLAHERREEAKNIKLKQSKKSIESLLEKEKVKELPIVIRADMQGSLEALKSSLMKIKSKKIKINIVSEGIGEISESDIELAAASNAAIVGFHIGIESHAEPLIKKDKIEVIKHDIIYHLIDDVKELMKSKLDKIENEVDKGTLLVKAIFKSSQVGTIAGCIVTDGYVNRNYYIRVIRDKETIHKGKIASLKRVKDDIKEAQKGMECGILLEGFSDFQEKDILEAYEIVYLEQEL